MSCEIVVSVKGLSKCYRVYDKPHHRLMQMIQKDRKQYFREFWVLRDISFDVEKGQVLGILGKNGAGKSTLLQILCGTVASTTGDVLIKGRIAALLELGAGFNPEFTGVENVYMNGQILGLTKTYIDSKIDEIKAFADIGAFFYQPVKTYSSGMFARLAFSVAVHVEPDILIVDEALSVGDSWFQHKSMARMKELMAQGCTVLFVSHSIESVRALCQKAMWLENGSIKAYGDATTVTNQYMNDVFVAHNRIILDSNQPVLEKYLDTSKESLIDSNASVDNSLEVFDAAHQLDGGAVLSVESVKILNSSQKSVDKLYQGEQFVLEVIVRFLTDLKNISVGFLIKDQFGQELTGESVFNTYRHSLDFQARQLVKFCFSSFMNFRGGQSYSVSLRINQVSCWDRSDNVLIYIDELASVFEVLSDPDNPMWFKVKQHFEISIDG